MIDDVSDDPSGDDGADSGLAAALDFSVTVDDGQSEVDESQGPLFTVTNPPGSVTVTTFLNGQVQRVDLSPSVTKMTEAQLAHEILVVAGIAGMKARAALHSFVAGVMRMQGMDSSSARDFVERRLSLPTPEQASAAEAEFAARYARDGE